MALLALWNPNIQFLKTDGTINAGGKIIVTDHNDAESIPANYSDADGTTLNHSPIVLDALGRATCYIDYGSTYDLYVKDSNGATLWTVTEMTPGAETIVVRAGFSVSSNDSSVAVVISVDQNGVTNYDLSIQKEIDRATETEKGLADAIEAEKNRAESAESALSKSIADKAGTASPLMDGKASVGNSLKYAREDHVHPADTSREAKANKTTVVLGTSDDKYPTDKAVAEFVNSSIATNTANYISNNGEPFASVEQLEAYSGTVTNNDYAFVTGTDSEGNTYYDRYKATVSGSTVTWALEYRLNNSSFTAAQWAAINSGITSDKANYWDGKQDALTFDTTPTAGSSNPVTSDGIKKAIDVVKQSKANQFSLGSTAGSKVYTMFARMSDENLYDDGEAQVILSSAGNYGTTNQGTWEIIVSNRGSTASSPKAYMTVRCINAVQVKSGVVTEPTFGYYIDTTNHYIYFGIYSPPFRGNSRITVLVNSLAILQDFGDSTTAPTGWTTVTPTGVSSAETADKAYADGNGNNIVNTYATKTELNAKQNRLSPGTGISISGDTVSTNLPLSEDNGTTVKKNVWYIFAMANVTGGVWERCWDFLIASNHNSSAQMRLFISPRISASGSIDSGTIVQVDGHVTPTQLEKYKIATAKDSSGKLYCCLCVKHSNSDENRTVQWNLRNARGPSWWAESTPLSNYTVVSERLLSESMSSNRLVCFKPTDKAAVGDATQPVYVDAYGMIKACSSMPKFVIGTPAGAADTIYFT